MNNRIIKSFIKLIKNISIWLTDILLPKEKRVKLLEQLGPDGLYENIPRAENFDLSSRAGFKTNKISAIFGYQNKLCRQAIWEIKYRANKKLLEDFSLLLYEYILEELSDLDTFHNFKKPYLIPIPSAKSRDREKGFNQCILITRELLKIDKERNGNNFQSAENFLIKKEDTPHQARVSNRKKRLKNLIGAFSINKNCDFPTKTELLSAETKAQSWTSSSFIIIDDVITTGATMREAFRTLNSAGIPTRHIRGFALAH